MLNIKIVHLLQEAHKNRLFTSATLGVSLNGKKYFFTASNEGVAYVPNRLLKSQNKIYDIASVTKFLLSILVFRLLTIRDDLVKEIDSSGSNGTPRKKNALELVEKILRFHLDEPVSKFMHISGAFSDKLLVRHLLNFHVEFRKFMEPDKIIKQNLKVLFAQLRHVGCVFEPGTKHRYANAQSILLGLLLEKVYDEPLEVLFQKHLIKPLGLSQTTTNPCGMLNRVVPAAPHVLCGQIHDPVAQHAREEGRLLGHSGLFSSADDLLRVVDLVLHGGYIGSVSEVEKPFILPFWIERLHQAENPDRKFAMGMAYWDELRRNLEHHNPTEVQNGLFKSGFTGPAVATFKEVGAGYALVMDYLGPIRTAEEAKMAKGLRSALYVAIGEEVIRAGLEA